MSNGKKPDHISSYSLLSATEEQAFQAWGFRQVSCINKGFVTMLYTCTCEHAYRPVSHCSNFGALGPNSVAFYRAVDISDVLNWESFQ